MRAALALVCVSGVSGACGGAVARPAIDATQLATTDAEVQAVGDLQVVTLSRDTPGLVHLSLFVDAGSRDAAPPQVATLAGWLAASVAGPAVAARTLPDGTELAVRGTQEELDAHLAGLARALGARAVDADAFAAARARLVDDRLAAATDPWRRLDEQALIALCGDAASGFFPLGAPDTDDEASSEAVEAFLSAHYGPGRATLVVSGDVPDDVTARVERAFAGAPAASARRAPRDLPTSGPRTRVIVGDAGRVTVAAALPDLDTAARTAQRLRARGLTPLAFDVRGGAILLARARSRGGDARRAVHEVARAIADRLRDDPLPPTLPTDAPSATAAAIGYRFFAGHATTAPAPAIAVAAEIDGGRADDPAAEDPDADARQALEAALSEARSAGLALAEPELHGERDDEHAAVRLDNGARITVRYRPGEWVGVAVRFGGGAAREPRSLHGRSALLASLTARACRLRGARTRPIVAAAAWGVVIEVPRARAQEAIRHAVDCATGATADATSVEQARGAASVLASTPDAEAAAWGALAIAPDAPGAVAPRGDVATLRNVTVGEARRALARARVGGRVRVHVVGDVDVEDAVGRAGRGLAALAPGEPLVDAEIGPAARELLAEPVEGPTARAVVALRADGAGHSAAARAFAEVLAERLAADTGGRVIYADGGGGFATWAAVGLELAPDALEGLETFARAALRELRSSEVAARAAERDRRARWARAHPTGATVEEPPATAEDVNLVARSLSSSEPRFVLGRPR